MTDEWNPLDPDATRVHYDLSGWTFDQQAELASELAEGSIPHAWDSTDLIVPELFETATDDAIAAVELRLNIADAPPSGHEPIMLELADGETSTEYDLSEWPAPDRLAISEALTNGSVAFRWEGESADTLVIKSSDESLVDDLLDAVERGELTASQLSASGDMGQDDDDDQLPFETLTRFFLAGERLQRNSANPDGLAELIAAIEVANPARPPYGVERRLWERACQLAGEISDALIGDQQPDDDVAQQAASELYDLLRPFV